MGNAEPIARLQAAPDNDVAVIVMRDPRIDPKFSHNGGMKFFRLRYEDESEEWAIEQARDFARRKCAEGLVFMAGHTGYMSRDGSDYTRTSEWQLNG